MATLVVVFLIAMFSAAQPAPVTTGSITGHVLEEGSNRPIVGARVSLFPQARPSIPGPPAQATSDADGAFSFSALAPGDYRLDVQKAGYVSFGYVDISARPAMPRPFHVDAGQPTVFDVHLRKGGVIAGHVLDVNGEPLVEARIMALRRISPPGQPSRLMPAPSQGAPPTNDIGDFRIAGLAPGEYYIAVSPRMTMPFGAQRTPPPADGPRTTGATTYYPGTTDPAGAQPITVAAGETVSGIQFTMLSAPAFRVSGIVVDENGQPAAGAMVMLMNDPRNGPVFGPGGNTRTGDDGRFTIDDVVAGSYRITASIPVMMNGREGGGIGAVSGGVSFSSSGVPAPAPEIVVSDTDIKGLRVVARRPQ